MPQVELLGSLSLSLTLSLMLLFIHEFVQSRSSDGDEERKKRTEVCVAFLHHGHLFRGCSWPRQGAQMV